MRRALLAALAIAAASCRPALREPPSLESLMSHPPTGTGGDAAAVLAKADAAWARRPDAARVREAEFLYFDAAHADAKGIDGLVGAVRAKAWLANHETDGKKREELAVSAVQISQWCMKRQPEAAACAYWQAISVGLQAREIRATADDGLKKMVAQLQSAIEKDPLYDEAGPHRILAIVLARAPGWPLGPGDSEASLEEARKAESLKPDYPPNVLAVAEALAANKDRAGAREAYTRAKTMAVPRRDAGDPDAAGWITEADEALAKIKP